MLVGGLGEVVDAREAGVEEETRELGVFEVVGDVGNADLFVGCLMTEEDLRVATSVGGVEGDGEEDIVRLGIGNADVGDELFGGLFVVKGLVDEEDSAGDEEITEDLQCVEDVGKRLFAIDNTVVVPESAGVDERISATDECVELFVAEHARQCAPLR